MVYLHAENTNFGIFWNVKCWYIIMAVWYSLLRPFGIVYGRLVIFLAIRFFVQRKIFQSCLTSETIRIDDKFMGN
jgi:hypothetical protein